MENIDINNQTMPFGYTEFPKKPFYLERQGLAGLKEVTREQIEKEIITLLFLDVDGNTVRILNAVWNMELNFNYESDSLDDPFCLFDNINYGALFSEVWKMKAQGEDVDPVSVINKIGKKHNIDLEYINDILNGYINGSPENILKHALILLGFHWQGERLIGE